MLNIALTFALLLAAGNMPVTGAQDAPKTTTTATEAKTTDAAGLGAPVPGATPGGHVPPNAPVPHHKHHHPRARITPGAPR
jgi:hypothetical protein